MSNLYNLAWHDFYLLHNIFGEDFSDIEKIDTKRTLSFSMKLGGKKINFCYDRLSKENSHNINGVNLMHDGNDADALLKCLSMFLTTMTIQKIKIGHYLC